MKKFESAFSVHSGKKSSFFSLLILITALLLFEAFINSEDLPGTIIYVSVNGKDNDPGTRDQPLKSFKAARDAARDKGTANCRIIVLPGEYFLSEQFELDSRDNGLIIEAEKAGTVVIIGGTKVTGWYKDGDNLWCADLPGVREGTWDFRTLVVNGRMAERARYPDTGTFFHKQVTDNKWFDIAWARQPTYEELTTMAYDPGDIPSDLNVKNAEVRVYHMWNESMVGVARNDLQRHILTFSSPSINPPGGYGIMKYVIFNTSEGMTRPGQWYLDRTGGRVVYWPVKDEDMSTAKAIAPRTERIFYIAGTKEKMVEKITIRGMIFNVTNIPLKSAGFGAVSFSGAVNIEFANHCVLEDLEINSAGGVGISAQEMTACRITGCNIYNTGAAGVRLNGSDCFISGNKIHDLGVSFPGSVGLSVNGNKLHIYRNEVFNIPYSGMIIGGNDHLVEENHIFRVMLELHDGAAIYCGSGNRVIYRGNLAHDIKAFGKGFGVSSYYFDSGTKDCIMERNVSIRVPRPIHLDYTTNAIVRDNVFITDGDMVLSFQQSSDCSFEKNIIVAPGKITIGWPNAVTTWKENVVYRNGQVMNGVPQAFTIDSAMPPYSIPDRKTYSMKAVRVSKAPVLDGNLDYTEWPGDVFQLNRESSRLPSSGWSPRVELSYDNKNLYLGVFLTMRDPGLIKRGSVWGQNDGLEVSIAGKTTEGTPATFVVRVYADGTIQSITDAGAPGFSAQRLARQILVITKDQKPTRGGGWSCEWAIPFKAIGIKPVPGMNIPFNMCSYANEYDNWHMWEGTLGESWQVEKGGVLTLQ